MTDTAKPETPYVETEVLLAVMNQDFSRAGSLALEMTRKERTELCAALGYARQVLEAADARMAEGDVWYDRQLAAGVGHATGDPQR